MAALVSIRLWGVAAAVALLVAFWGHSDTNADHNIFLPLVPKTPLMQQIIETQEYVWCADQRSSTYPSFLSHLEDVNAQYAERVGVRSRQVGFGDLACQVKHTMPDSFPCGEAAACIYYANWPVIVAYRYTLGYQDWRSAQGHELGHGVLGLHEQYADSGGNIQCTGRQDTVMDCGSGVRYPQTIDVDRGCSIIATVWCGQPASVEEWGECQNVASGWRCFNNNLGLWVRWQPEPSIWVAEPFGPWLCTERCPD